MQTISLLWGLLALAGMLFGFIPLLGWWNWFNIPFAGLGLLISALALAGAGPNRNKALAGFLGCAVALIFGLIRLAVGGGIL